MVRDTRIDEIKKNPSEAIPNYFAKGWLGGKTLKKAWENYKEFEEKKDKVKKTLQKKDVSDEDYVLAAEQSFLYGKVGKKVLLECSKQYLLGKGTRRRPEDYLHMFVEIQDNKGVNARELVNKNQVEDVIDISVNPSKQETEFEIDAVQEADSADNENFLETVKKYDKDHVWMFDAGNNGRSDFRGNPKYLFIYINRYRPDIFAYWYGEETAETAIEQVRNLGYVGVYQGSKEANELLNRTGVVVSEMAREFIPSPLKNCKYLNLWHGIGFKRIERGIQLNQSDLRLLIAKKYILNNPFYINNQIACVTSPMYEEEFSEDLGLSKEHMLRTGYLRCSYQQKYEPVVTYDHNLIYKEGVKAGARIAVYAPTYRAKRGNSFVTGMKDLEALYKCCEENNIIMIFKPHQYIENEEGFLAAAEYYKDKPYFVFWDNANDFYEIMHKVDLVIYDYSSIFSDFLCAGVKHYIRYIYDEEEYMQDGFTQGSDAYYDRTCGIICRTFSELLSSIENYLSTESLNETKKIYKKLWAYAGNDDFEKTIQATMDFKPSEKINPVLYSFDVFDTLISRKGLHPYSIFYKVAERMKSDGSFESDFINRYPSIRHSAEMNVREYYQKTVQIRESDKIEIQLSEIFDRIKDVYGISDFQAQQLKKWEIEEEIESVVPIEHNIQKVKKLLDDGEQVVLISDMYLSQEIIRKMVVKADEKLRTVPIFVSCEYGVQKTNRLLFYEVYKSFKPFFNFSKWVHYGDNVLADKNAPKRLGINTVQVPRIDFNEFEKKYIDKTQQYDSYLYSALCARLRDQVMHKTGKGEFVVDIVGSILIPYVDLVLRDAIKKGFEVLYFVARDGYFMKVIADELIKANNWKIETRYLYASRRTWRVQSYIDKVDDIFWIPQGGNFNDIHSKEEMLSALYMSENDFNALIPQIDLDKVDWEDRQPGRKLAPIIKESKEYNDYLLKYAEKTRDISAEYLLQELELDKKIAFVEYWARGYNQECMTRLLNYKTNKEYKSYYYYARSICPSEGNCIRYNITDIDTNISVFEAIFANMPYKSVEEYEYTADGIKPVLVKNPFFDNTLYDAMHIVLPTMARQYAQAEFVSPEAFSRVLFDYALEYLCNNRQEPLLADNIGSLCYSMSMYGAVEDYAKPFTMKDLDDFAQNKPRGDDTSSIQMSYARSPKDVRQRYDKMYQLLPGEDPFKSPRLSEKEIINNDNFDKRYDTVYARAIRARESYVKACKYWNVSNIVMLVSSTPRLTSEALISIKNELEKNNELLVEWVSSNIPQEKDEDFMRRVAMAKYIIVDGCIEQFVNIQFRPETTCISILDRGFRLYNYGRNEKVRLNNQSKFNKLIYSKNPKVIERTSMMGLENSGFVMNEEKTEKLSGACITDVLFDEDFKNRSLEQIWKIAPESKGKKIIVYMPMPRKRVNSGNWLELLDIEQMADALADEYYLLLDVRGNNLLVDNSDNTIDIKGFSTNVSKANISMRSLLSVADVVIGDYRDTFFESALLNVPVFSTAIDMDKIQSNSLNVMYDLKTIYPFPIVNNAEELINSLNRTYDYSKINDFRNTYLIGCDGKASKRMADYIKNLQKD